VEADGRRVLQDVSFSIPAKSIALIVGPSGAGKSTLIEVLFGVRERSEGEILFDHTPLDELDLNTLHARIGYVPQDGQFFHDTVASNLRLKKPDATDAELWAALELAQAKDFVREFPQGLGTVMGAQGFKLSGGERQRLALARALMTDPDILVLDEPTSALDPATERAYMESLLRFKGRMTMIIVAHRTSLIQHADLVLRVENGGVQGASDSGQHLAPVGKIAP
jgi:ABC-type multidrug transport system fused ATPase/permease subunit